MMVLKKSAKLGNTFDNWTVKFFSKIVFSLYFHSFPIGVGFYLIYSIYVSKNAAYKIINIDPVVEFSYLDSKLRNPRKYQNDGLKVLS